MSLELQLTQFGFRNKEAQVYIAGLEAPHSSIQDLTQHSGLRRSTVAFTLKNLLEKGMIVREKKNKRNVYSVVQPKQLFNLQKQKLQMFEQLLPELLAHTKPTKTAPRVKLYDTIEGMKTAFEEMLDDKPREFRAILNADMLASVADRYFIDEFRKRRFETGIKSKIITVNNKEGQHLTRTQKHFNSETKLLPSGYVFEAELLTWNQKALLIHYLENERILLMIESGPISRFMNTVFDFFWNHI